jgi:hypothetical protein
MSLTPDQAQWFRQTFDAMADNVEKAVLGKRHIVKLALTCLLAEGHLLLEDFPGTGKTQMARALANTIQGTNSRIQFTPDLLPSDVTGVTVYDQNKGAFEFQPGPDLPQHRARRRDQPRLAQDAVRAARGDGRQRQPSWSSPRRTPSTAVRLPDARAAAAVHGRSPPRTRSSRPRRHLPPAREQLDRFLIPELGSAGGVRWPSSRRAS